MRRVEGKKEGRSNLLPPFRPLPSRVDYQTYERYVILHTELAMMSAADVFVGTFSSNIARLVFLVREGLGFPRNSTISVDDPLWHLGRRTRA